MHRLGSLGSGGAATLFAAHRAANKTGLILKMRDVAHGDMRGRPALENRRVAHAPAHRTQDHRKPTLKETP